jgi:hypothetical protein
MTDRQELKNFKKNDLFDGDLIIRAVGDTLV